MNRLAWVALAALSATVGAAGRNDADKKETARVQAANEPPAPRDPGEDKCGATKVAVVDEPKALQDSGLAKEIQDRLAEARQNATDSLQRTLARLRDKAAPLQARRDEAIKAAQAELMKRKPSTEPENEVRELTQKLAALDYLGRAVDQGKVQQLQGYERDMLAKLRNDIQPTLQAVAASKDIDIILIKGQAMYAEPATDITQHLVKALSGKALPRLLAVPEDLGKDTDLSKQLKELGL